MAEVQVSLDEKSYRRAAVALGTLMRVGSWAYHGEENLPSDEEPYILAAVHRSILDPIALGCSVLEATNRSINFMAKQELWNDWWAKPVKLGKLIQRWGAFPVDRDQPTRDTIANVKTVVNNGSILGIFPEGERKKGSTIRREDLKDGVATFAVHHQLKIVPVGIAGTAHHDRWPVEVSFGTPIEAAQTLVHRSQRKELKEVVMGELHEGMQQAQDKANELRTEAQIRSAQLFSTPHVSL